MEVRHINRSSSATRHAKVYTPASIPSIMLGRLHRDWEPTKPRRSRMPELMVAMSSRVAWSRLPVDHA